MLQALVHKINKQPRRTPEEVISSPEYNYTKTTTSDSQAAGTSSKKPEAGKKRKPKILYRESEHLSDLSKVYNRFEINKLQRISLEYLAKLRSIKDAVQAELKDIGIDKSLNHRLFSKNINEMILAKSQAAQNFRSLIITDLRKIIANELEKSTGTNQQLFLHNTNSFDITTKLIVYSTGNKLQGLAQILENQPKESVTLDHSSYSILIDKAYKEFQLSSTDCIRAINYLANLIKANGRVAISSKQSNEEKLNMLCAHIRVFLLALNKNL